MATKVITFSLIEGCDEFASWKKLRREYVRTLGHSLLVCSENEIIRIFDNWELQIHELIKIDKSNNYYTALLIISLLHYFNRSYDQMKEYIPFITKMLENKSRKMICAASQTLRYLVKEQSDNYDFLRNLIANDATKWIISTTMRYSALKLLLAAGKFLLPTIFEVTSNSFQSLWNTVICDDVELRTLAAKVIDLHLCGLPKSSISDVHNLFKDCINQMKLQNATSHGPILVCRSLLYRYPEEIDVPKLINCLFELVQVKSEVLIVAVFSLLFDISRQMPYLFTPDTVHLFISGLITNCSRYPLVTELFDMINKSIMSFKPQLLPVSTIVDYLKQVIKAPKFKTQHELGFKILQNLFKLFRDLTVPASYFLEAVPSPGYVHALRMRMALFKDTKATLLKYFNEGLSPKAQSNQVILSLHILKEFDSHLFTNKEQVFTQIRPLRRSPIEEIRLLIVEVLPLFMNTTALDDLLFLALFDPLKSVRSAAVKELKFPNRLAHCEMLTQILNDPSYKVKRNAIPIIAAVAPLNPLQFYVPISTLVEQTISSMASSSNPCYCARISSLMPLIAEHFIKFCPAFIPQLTKICFSFLKTDDNNTKEDYSLNQIKTRDLSHDGHALIIKKLPFDENCRNLLRIFQIENQEWIDNRDANLFSTLQKLAPYLHDFIQDLIPIFVSIFSISRSNKVYITALDALNEIVVKNAIVSKFPTDHSPLVPVLMVLLNSQPSDDVAVKIIKLMGTFGITSFPTSLIEVQNEIDPITGFDFKSPSFYTDFTMTALLKLLNEPHSSIFEAVSSIFVKEADAAAKFLPQVVSAFIKSIATSKGTQRDELFKQLEIISYYSGIKMQPFVYLIVPHIEKHIKNISALRIALILSYFLKSEFIPNVSSLYQKALNMISFVLKEQGKANSNSSNTNNSNVAHIDINERTSYFSILMQFLTSAVVFQMQPLSLLVIECERALSLNINEHYASCIINSLTTIVQLGDASFECTHIARFSSRLLTMPYKSIVFQLLFSLSVYCNLTPDCISSLARREGVPIPAHLATLKEYQYDKSIPLDSFLTKHSISISIQNPDYVPQTAPQTSQIFDEFPPPQFNNTAKWLEDLSAVVVSESPSFAIRACRKLVKNSPSFRSDIFPIAFLSCWMVTKKRDQANFSLILQDVFETDKQLNPAFLRLAELLVRCGHPLNISFFVIASACHSPALALRFLVRHVEENPNDVDALELMLTLNMRLGRHSSSRGILQRYKLPTAGSWYEKLGRWEEALSIYQKKNDIDKTIKCLAMLEKWDEIRDLAKVYQTMSEEQKKNNAIWLAWAFYRANDLPKTSVFVNKLGDTDDLEVLLFRSIFLVASNQNKAAKVCIDKSMQTLVKDCSIYSPLNASLATNNLMYANFFIELQEAIEIKKKSIKEIPLIWTRRLNSLTGDSYSWANLVEIRNLALSPSENRQSYLKLISILIKERHWTLVDSFFTQVSNLMDDPELLLEYYKMLWSRYQKRVAVDSIHLLNLTYQNNISEIHIKEEIQNISPESLYFRVQEMKRLKISCDDSIITVHPDETVTINEDKLYKWILDKKSKLPQITNKLRSRLLRIEGTWRSQLYQKSESMKSLVYTINIFKEASSLCPDDYRNWAGFAYAASRAIDDLSFVTSAINGFLRVIQLCTSNNLEYLCLLFSLFFRYGSDVSIPSEIANLTPEIVFEVLPQIVCQINHPDENVRNIVHELIYKFSKNHFEAISFPLHLLIRSEDETKMAIARDLLLKVSANHTELANEAEIFVSGLLRAAVTWYEIWMNKLDAAFLESRRSPEIGTRMLRQLFESRKSPQCQMDIDFNKVLESPLSTCANTLAHFTPTEGYCNTLWTQLKRLYEILRDKFKVIETIQLSMVSTELSNKRKFLLSIPGTYSVINKYPQIEKLDQTLPILTTQQHPRLLFMSDTEGRRWKFLLKGNEDLRLDQRIMQFFGLINSLLKTDSLTKRLQVDISKYAIIPIAPNAGLISWVTGADTMHQLVMDYRIQNGIIPWIENEEMRNLVDCQFDALNHLQKHEMWDAISVKYHAIELRELFWEKASDANSWLKCIDQFILSTALMSMAGYVIGLGDRHPCNIMIQRQTGRVVHIDFGDSFEIALNREKMPEKVPFRLTRMLVNAFGVNGIDGPYRSACESILRVLRNNKSSISAQLEIFVHEPIFVNRENGSMLEGRGKILDRIIEKLSGNDPKPDFLDENDSQKELSVEDQVNKLIEIASDPYRYVQHYIGWCQFW